VFFFFFIFFFFFFFPLCLVSSFFSFLNRTFAVRFVVACRSGLFPLFKLVLIAERNRQTSLFHSLFHSLFIFFFFLLYFFFFFFFFPLFIFFFFFLSSRKCIWSQWRSRKKPQSVTWTSFFYFPKWKQTQNEMQF